ncbi:MAG: FadR/GntR family transcriptional regulator [Pirellulaceae bacterium]|jgi:GntR family transcriptional repressor for pyruvate dehydrogenase complex|nr:FadR/GntR family transcriptional regulator [Pirellulaceae bacterium]MDP7016471.1 FadR/GntR family transcriptional regulator [Pirellulaceae bacterium]
MTTDLLGIEPIRRVTLVDTVVERIRGVIETGELKSGDRLPGELQLTDGMNVSRSVVREAISRLQSIGLVTVLRGRRGGTFVGDPNTVLNYARVVRSAVSICDRDARQLAEFRAALEIFSARRAAELATDADVEKLTSLCELIGATPSGDGADADFQFHRQLAQIAKNEVIIHTLEMSREFIQTTIRTGPQDPLRSRAQHEQVVDAIRRRDPDAAERAMRVHMDSVIGELTGDGCPERATATP